MYNRVFMTSLASAELPRDSFFLGISVLDYAIIEDPKRSGGCVARSATKTCVARLAYLRSRYGTAMWSILLGSMRFYYII